MVALFSDFVYTFCSAKLRVVTLFMKLVKFHSSGWAVFSAWCVTTATSTAFARGISHGSVEFPPSSVMRLSMHCILLDFLKLFYVAVQLITNLAFNGLRLSGHLYGYVEPKFWLHLKSVTALCQISISRFCLESFRL